MLSGDIWKYGKKGGDGITMLEMSLEELKNNTKILYYLNFIIMTQQMVH